MAYFFTWILIWICLDSWLLELASVSSRDDKLLSLIEIAFIRKFGQTLHRCPSQISTLRLV